jgi:hypothetical protein
MDRQPVMHSGFVRQRASRRVLVALLAAGPIVVWAGLGTAPSLAADAHGRTPSSAAGGPVAVAAHTIAVSDTTHMHMITHQHEVITEEGHATGNLSGNLAIRLTLAYTQASVTFVAHPSGGTIVGRGEGAYYVQGNTAHFVGTASITGGTGKYAHVSGNGIHIAGTLQRTTFAFLVQFAGTIRY